MRSKKTGNWFATRWSGDLERVVITWPTFFLAPMFATIGFCLTVLMSVWAVINGQWIWPVLLLIVTVLSTLCCMFVREKFVIDRKRVSKSKWPAGLQGQEEHAIETVVGAVVQLDVFYGQRTRRIGTVKVRVRTPDGIEWLKVGLDLGWGEASAIGAALGTHMKVRVIRNE